jgi:anti-sigma factor RsiW
VKIMIRELTQIETEQLNAWLDGELDAAEASRVEALVASDAAWAQAAGELQSLDGLLGQYTVPAAPVELADRIVAAARREQPAGQWTIRLVKYMAPVAAIAAALILFVAFYHPTTTNPPTANNQVANNNIQKSQQDLDAVIVEHLPFFKQYEAADKVAHTDAVVDDATLKALDQLEHSQGT